MLEKRVKIVKINKTICKNENCICENKQCDYLHKQYGLSRWVFNIIKITIIFGIIVPFAAETVLPFFCKNNYAINHLSIWNQFVSIILGIIAVVLSIVSIIMSFKNYDDTFKLAKKYEKQLVYMEEMLDAMNEVKQGIYTNSLKADIINPSQNIREYIWMKENKEG